MKANEIRDLNDADLTARIAELEEARFRLRFRGATEQLEDPLRIRGIRRDIARLKTVQRQRVLEGAGKAKGTGTATTSAKKSTAKKSTAKKSAAKKGAQGASTTKASAAKKKAPAKKAATGAGR
jgi:large subunit ribosomal protein L29